MLKAPIIFILEIDSNTSPFLEFIIAETEAIAAEPQIAFPILKRIDKSVERLKNFEIRKVIKNANSTKHII